MPPRPEGEREGRASQDDSRSSSPYKIETNLTMTPSAESFTSTPASTVDTPSDRAIVKEVSMSGQEAHNGTETPRMPDARSASLESQLGELQARLKILETQTQSERNMETMMDMMKQKLLSETHPIVNAGSNGSSETDSDSGSSVAGRRRRRRQSGGKNYASRAIRLFEGEIKTLRQEQDRESKLKEERDRLLEKELLWKDERKELLRQLDELQKHSTMEGSSERRDDGESNAPEKILAPTLKAEVNYVDWQHFSLRYAKGAQSCAIDVLEGDPVLAWETTQPSNPLGLDSTGARATWSASEEKSKSRKTKSSIPGQAPLPERIRINSTLILKILRDIRGDSEDSHSDTSSSTGNSSHDSSRDERRDERSNERDLTPLIMIRPYKSLAYYDKPIRSKLQELEAEFGQKTVETEHEITKSPPKELETGAGGGAETSTTESEQRTPASESGGGEGDSSAASDDEHWESTFSLAAYEHLRCLVKFMDDHLVKKMTYLSSDRCQTVVFSDIWYLFKPGDEVIEQSGLQAYRIISITSAPHRALPPYLNRAEFDMEDRVPDSTPVSLFCVHVDFNGKELGPRVRKVRIARFDGERPVTSLEVYPLRFTEDFGTRNGRTEASGPDRLQGQPPLRQRLIDRGRLFMSMTKFKHMHYSGLTLDRHDEVDSPVVVDFEEAFTRAQQKEMDSSEDVAMMHGRRFPPPGYTGVIYDSDRAQQGWRPKLNRLAGRLLEWSDDYDQICVAECCADQNILQESNVEKERNEGYRASLMPQDRQQRPSPSIHPQTVPQAKRDEIPISEEDLVIMSHRVFGFVLRTRKWAKLDINHITPPEGSVVDGDLQPESTKDLTDKDAQGTRQEDQTAFGHLVLPHGHKEMVKALVAQHFRDKDAASMESKTQQVDIVRGKGKGLIILLHGAPGVGKTTTAEGVAEMFQKPLFQITCGDLGTSAHEVEKALEMHFTLANRWGCILLLDEADVFLASRSKQDFERNGLVSVFLRVLEYYAGILFLTTNRVGDFDEAFTSRIHISLYYPQLDLKSTLSVFQLNLDMIKKRFRRKDRKISIEEKLILESAATYFNDHQGERWNGRQIRNACQTALALAEYRAQGSNHLHKVDVNAQVELKKEDLETVSTAYLHFIQYINSILGDAEMHAKKMRLRAREPAQKEVQANSGTQSVPDRPAATVTPRSPRGPWSPPPVASPSAVVPQPAPQPTPQAIPYAGHAVPPSQFGPNLAVPAAYYPPHPSQAYGQPQMPPGVYVPQGDSQGGAPPQHAAGTGQGQPVYYPPYPQYQQPQAYGHPPGQVPGYAMASPTPGNTGQSPASSQPQ